MRVWDVHPGYLSRQSLLGEHREIHALVSIVENGRRGYANHPETRRWRAHIPALRLRHDVVVAEMALRGYQHRSPLQGARGGPWPNVFLDSPAEQLSILGQKYAQRAGGRIVLPRTVARLWAQHRYSALARGLGSLTELGQGAGTLRFEVLAEQLADLFHAAPTGTGLDVALQEMWDDLPRSEQSGRSAPLGRRDKLASLQQLAVQHDLDPLRQSTALSELAIWLEPHAEILRCAQNDMAAAETELGGSA